MIQPVAFSSALVRSSCCSMISRNRAVNGKLRSSLFLVSPGSSRSRPRPLGIGMILLAGKNLIINSPAGDICGFDWRLQIFRQIFEHERELLPLEESLPRIVDREFADVRFRCDTIRSNVPSLNMREHAESSLLMVELAAFWFCRKVTYAVTVSPLTSAARASEIFSQLGDGFLKTW